MIAKNPHATYNMSFTKPDNKGDGTEILLQIRPNFKRATAVIKPDIEFAKAVLKDKRELGLIEKTVEALRIWGIQTFQLDLNGKMGDKYLTQIAYPEDNPNVGKQQVFWDKIPKKQLTTAQIQYYIQLGKDLREREQRGEAQLAFKLNVKELGVSLDIRPNFKENNALFVVNDTFDFETKDHMELIGFAVAIIKLWDLATFDLGKEH